MESRGVKKCGYLLGKQDGRLAAAARVYFQVSQTSGA